jgi:hypothetical protein
MQYAGTAFPVRPGGHFGGGTAAALALAAALGVGGGVELGGGVTAEGAILADAEEDAAAPFASSLSQAERATTRPIEANRGRMGEHSNAASLSREEIAPAHRAIIAQGGVP